MNVLNELIELDAYLYGSEVNVQNMAKGMNDVQRFDFERGYDGYRYADPDGSYVLFDDYAALQQQLAAAREALQSAEARYRVARRYLSAHLIENNVKWHDEVRHSEYLSRVDAAIDATLQRDRQP